MHTAKHFLCLPIAHFLSAQPLMSCVQQHLPAANRGSARLLPQGYGYPSDSGGLYPGAGDPPLSVRAGAAPAAAGGGGGPPSCDGSSSIPSFRCSLGLSAPGRLWARLQLIDYTTAVKRVNGLFLREKLFDYADIVVAPVLIGGRDTSTLIDGASLVSQIPYAAFV